MGAFLYFGKGQLLFIFTKNISMKTLRINILIILLALIHALPAQTYLGAHYSTYDAILSGNTNPAMPAATDMKWQVNLFGVSMNLNNNYFAIDGKIRDVIQNFDQETSFTQMLDGKRKNLHLGAEIMGPAGFFNIKGNAITIGTKAKAVGSLNDFNENLVYSLYNDFEDILNWIPSFTDERASGGVVAFHEIYAGYSRTIDLNDRHKLHVGANVGLITNLFNAQFTADNIDFNKIYMGLDSAINVGNTQFDFFVSDHIDDGYNYKFGVNGFGVDAGVIYEFQKQNTEDHFLLAGFSANDLGFTKYNLGTNSRSFIGNNRNIPASSLVDGSGETNNLDQVLDSLGTRTVPTGKRKVLLPTTLNAFADVRVVKMFYVNANFQFNLFSFKKGDGKANMPTDITVTPRFETKIFSAFVPMNWNKYNGFTAGAGIRVAQFTIGSRNIITAFAKKHFTGVDLYLNIGFGKVNKNKGKKDKGGSEDESDQEPIKS
jgi:hypothetical protein